MLKSLRTIAEQSKVGGMVSRYDSRRSSAVVEGGR